MRGAAGVCMAGASGIMGRWWRGMEVKEEADEEGVKGCAERGELCPGRGHVSDNRMVCGAQWG